VPFLLVLDLFRQCQYLHVRSVFHRLRLPCYLSRQATQQMSTFHFMTSSPQLIIITYLYHNGIQTYSQSHSGPPSPIVSTSTNPLHVPANYPLLTLPKAGSYSANALLQTLFLKHRNSKHRSAYIQLQTVLLIARILA
jgi:hypothetical protein